MIRQLISYFFSPLLFGFAFIAPLIAQILDRLALDLPVSTLWIGLLVGGLLGLMAQFRGSWIWIRD